MSIDQKWMTIRASAGLYSLDRTTVLSWLITKAYTSGAPTVFWPTGTTGERADETKATADEPGRLSSRASSMCNFTALTTAWYEQELEIAGELGLSRTHAVSHRTIPLQERI